MRPVNLAILASVNFVSGVSAKSGVFATSAATSAPEKEIRKKQDNNLTTIILEKVLHWRRIATD
jgi:hypothetical protein